MANEANSFYYSCYLMLITFSINNDVPFAKLLISFSDDTLSYIEARSDDNTVACGVTYGYVCTVGSILVVNSPDKEVTACIFLNTGYGQGDNTLYSGIIIASFAKSDICNHSG